jgi:DNA repair exonuclease SbcCD ATPase subunit
MSSRNEKREREQTPKPESATSKPTWKGRPPSREQGQDTVIRTTPEKNRRHYRGEKSMKVYLERVDAAATLGAKSKDVTKTTVVAATLDEKSYDEPETVVTALAPLGEKLIAREEDESVIVATLDHSTPRTLSEPELREETPELRVEESREPSNEIPTGMASPLTKTTVLEKEVLETMARIQVQMQEQPELPLLEEDTLSFMGTGSIGVASGDLLSEACSVLTGTMYKTHEDAQNALYNAADSLCQSITFYKNRTTGLEKTVASLEDQQTEAQQKASTAEAELANLRREKKALEDALDEKSRSVEAWMSAKTEAEEEVERLRKERDDLEKEASRPTQALKEEVERLRTETREKTATIAMMSAQAEVRRQRGAEMTGKLR